MQTRIIIINLKGKDLIRFNIIVAKFPIFILILFIYIFFTKIGEKPFKCDKCASAFVRKDTLDIHYSRHFGEHTFQTLLVQ